MSKIIDFRVLYQVNHRCFNVNRDGVAIEKDELTGSEYITGSGDNVKHCLLEILYSKGYKPLTRTFVKKEQSSKNEQSSKKEQQGNVSTNIDITNPMQTFGGWDNMTKKSNTKKGDASETEVCKYKSVALKSSVNVGYFTPLNSSACELFKKQNLCCNGRETDELVFDDGKGNYYSTPAEMASGIGKPIEDCANWFNNQRKMNFAERKPSVTGVYELRITIDMDKFCTYSLDELHLTQDCEFVKNLIADKWSIVTINNEHYIRAPKEVRTKLFNDFAQAVHEFEFSSNNSSMGCPLVWLRSAFAVNNSNGVQSTAVANKYYKDYGDAPFYLYDGIENVHTFTSPNICSVYKVKSDNISIDVNAYNNSIKKLIELGNELL